ARLTQALNIPTLSAATGQDPIAEIHGNNIGVGYNLGVLYKINDNSRIGLDYHSRIRHNIYGAQKISVPALYSALSPDTAALLSSFNGSSTTNITLPDSLSLGLYQQLTPQLALVGTVEWTHWALFQSLVTTVDQGSIPGATINENWRNTWFAGVGANYQVNDKLMLQTGFSFDESPVTDSNRTTRIPDSNRYNIGFGAQYKVLPSTTLQFAYLHLFSPGTHTIDNSASSSAGTLTGSYNLSDNSVTAGIDVKF
ncbi:MAG TPA: outer membrane protein transport protein, partial [Acidocella sp.]|nr:outer membrane protein transport protein [Acidocella sp.]